jgi:hypothetical protein
VSQKCHTADSTIRYVHTLKNENVNLGMQCNAAHERINQLESLLSHYQPSTSYLQIDPAFSAEALQDSLQFPEPPFTNDTIELSRSQPDFVNISKAILNLGSSDLSLHTSTTPYPEYQDAIRLAEAYFTATSSDWPFLDKVEILHDIARLYAGKIGKGVDGQEPSREGFGILVIMAIACIIAGSAEQREKGTGFWRRAMRGLDVALLREDLVSSSLPCAL